MFIDVSDVSIEVHATWDRAPLDQIEVLSRYPVALIGDVQNRMGMMASAIRPMTGNTRFFGTILPVLTREGDNLALHRALDDARPGDVLVVNGNSETNRAVFGDIMGEICVSRGIAGVVIDGATRDVEELEKAGLPVFARAVNPAGPSKVGPGTVGLPIACGNVVCNPGDAILGDRDGVIVVASRHLATCVEKIARQDEFEEILRKKIRAS